MRTQTKFENNIQHLQTVARLPEQKVSIGDFVSKSVTVICNTAKLEWL